jgi:hypothetical protein
MIRRRELRVIAPLVYKHRNPEMDVLTSEIRKLKKEYLEKGGNNPELLYRLQLLETQSVEMEEKKKHETSRKEGIGFLFITEHVAIASYAIRILQAKLKFFEEENKLLRVKVEELTLGIIILYATWEIANVINMFAFLLRYCK